jgi:hypothetical protein
LANVTTAQRIVVEDFNDGIATGTWPVRSFPTTVLEEEGYLIMRARLPDTGSNSVLGGVGRTSSLSTGHTASIS